MPMFYYLEPEVAGGIGPNSELHRDDGKLVVTRLNYEFDGWLGDGLLETVACFIVTDDARQLIECAALTGVSFSDVEVTRSGLFTDLYGDKALPHFWWMIVRGEPQTDDFGHGKRHAACHVRACAGDFARGGIGARRGRTGRRLTAASHPISDVRARQSGCQNPTGS